MSIINKIRKLLQLAKEILRLPKVTLTFQSTDESYNEIKETYNYFTKLHPKYKIIKNKSLGVGLLELNKFKIGTDYLNTINGKNSAAYYARKASSREYLFLEIEVEQYKSDIFEVNLSADERQGRKMSDHYLQEIYKFDIKPHYRYFGVLDKNKKLRSYAYIGYFGDFAVVSQLLGHKQYLNDGVMYLMLTKIVCELINEKKVKYLMYDTFFGAKDGLRLFKEKLGFNAYKVKYVWEN